MQTSTTLRQPASSRIIAFIFYLISGILIFYFGANTFNRYPTNDNKLYEWGLTFLLLLLAVIMQRVPSLRRYAKLTSALFIASFANSANLALGNFMGEALHKTGSDLQSLAWDKLAQAIPIVVSIVLLTLWMGDDLGSIFLKRGKLRQGLKFGLISYAVFAVIFIIILVLQANAPARQGLFAAGVEINSVVTSLPWILMFCFVNSFMEELWFRGVSLGKLTPLMGTIPAIIVMALVFGGSHAGATYITPMEVILFPTITILLGLVNGYVMLKTDSIWGSVFFHAGYDLFVILPLMTS